MEAPKTLKKLRGFIGMVNCYHNMWPHRAHILTPLTTQTGAHKKGQTRQKYVLMEEMQTAFDQMKALMAMDILYAYPNHNNRSIFILMHLIISLVCALCKMVNLLYTIARS
jgi:hypothetical protein